jgi:hypothetical protein
MEWKNKQMLVFSHSLQLDGAPKWLYYVVKLLYERFGFHIMVISPENGPLKAFYSKIPVTVLVYDDMPNFHYMKSTNQQIFQWFEETLRNLYLNHYFIPDILFFNTILWVRFFMGMKLFHNYYQPDIIWTIHESELVASNHDPTGELFVQISGL